MITEEVLKKLGEDADCCICNENLVVNDKMQEFPCKHFHPPCLKPWLVIRIFQHLLYCLGEDNQNLLGSFSSGMLMVDITLLCSTESLKR
ncbi:hypothetical protein ACFX2I_042758 [Malus domestica]